MKAKTVFTCQKCAAQFPKWMGKCPECSSWNTLVEETYAQNTVQETSAKGHASFRQSLKDSTALNTADVTSIDDIEADETLRMATAFEEFDRVLGGGIIPGSLVLIGGDPGIGKSTILMQGLSSERLREETILYICAEESASQVKLRAKRLGVHGDKFFVLAENSMENVIDKIHKIKPSLLIIDSIQTIFSNQVQSAPGSVSQVRECTAKLMAIAKTLNIATFIVGHVTKDGSIAGPKVLEHMVDTVLYFEGSSHNAYRILRAVKNRFGSTNEIGVFEMNAVGLREVKNPSEIFLSERTLNAAGTTVVAAIEGSRPILVEVQALVSSSHLGTPRRTTLGMDHNKVSLLIAVLEKKLDLALYGHDIFLNVVGGIHIDEPAADLGAALAVVSSFRNVSIEPRLIAIGEVGLTGEIRRVSQLDLRLIEAEKLGFKKVIVPKSSLDALKKSGFKSSGIELIGVSTLNEAVDAVF